MSHGADLRRIDTWIFDLDETLYGPETGVMSGMEAQIDAYLLRKTGLQRSAVQAMRLQMRDEHGSTLAAMIAAGDDDVDAYLADVHDLPLHGLSADPRLREGLLRLPGRRLVHTNAPDFHAERVLAALGLADLFEAVFHCTAAGYALKPSAEAFTRLIHLYGVDPHRAAFFEDRAANLKPAAALGMTTVLVSSPDAEDASTPPWVMHRTTALADFLIAARVGENRP